MQQKQGLGILFTLASAVCIVYLFVEIQAAIPKDLVFSPFQQVFEVGDQEEVLPDTLLPDSLLAQINDSLWKDSTELVPDSILSLDNYHSYTGRQYLHRFYNAIKMAVTKKKKCRIAWFGDSMIEGDLITQDVRDSLQSAFGGRGVGWVPLVSVSAKYRGSIRHRFSGDWLNQSIVLPENPPFSYGIAGDVTFSKDSANADDEYWVSYKATSMTKNSTSLPSMVLYYGPSNAEGASPTIEIASGDQTTNYPLDGMGRVNTLSLLDQRVSSAKLTFDLPYSMPLYGVSIESDHGLILDNFASRGNSGLAYTAIRSSQIAAFQRVLDYDLVVLQFGLNVVSNLDNYDWYEKGMSVVINHVKKNMPNADFLLISVADKGKKIDGKMTTHPAIPKIVELQKRLAFDHNIGFYNLYDAMGGEGSIVEWVEGEPSLANKDYTHFNPKGAKKAGDMITGFLMTGYEEFFADSVTAETDTLLP